MKVPVWESSPGALLALLLSGRGAGAIGSFVKCDLHTFTLAGGAGVIRISAADLDVTYPGGPLWPATGARIDPKASRQVGHWKRGLDVDQWLTVILPRSIDPVTGAAFPDKINGSPFVAACRQGALDGAGYQVDRAYFPAWPQPWQPVWTPTGIITMFAGLTAEVDTNDAMVSITSNDYRTLLGASMPRIPFQSGCGHALFDAGCALSPVPFKVTGGVVAPPGGSRATLTSVAPMVPGGSGTFALGRVVMTSGLNATFSRTVVSWEGGNVFYLLNPLPYPVAAGDTFDAYPGCDKRQTTCVLFGNKANYGGQDYIPSPETAA